MLGAVIHGYRIDRALAADKGGFGDVFFATHVASGAEAVVKVLKPDMSVHHDIVERFLNEARAAASVHHPGIVQIHNVGYHQGRAYLLMERLRGDDLEGRLAQGPLPIDRAVTFMRQAAGAIGAAHERGVIHRDLKPANLFIVADPDVVGGERVKVLDFGIAKLTVDAGARKTQGVFGTPAYMSPEQCASAAAVDGRTDLYSLGCIFYELVSGRPPFGHGGVELIAAHLRDAPPPPRAIAPWLPPPLEQVILRLLEKHPDSRYPSCAALIAALDEAAWSLQLPAASAPGLPAMAGPRPSAPSGGSFGPSAQLSAGGTMLIQPAHRRGLGVWIAVAAVVVVAGTVAALTLSGGSRRPVEAGVRPADAGVVAVTPADAPGVDVASAVVSSADARREDVAREDARHEDVTREDVAREDVAREDVARADITADASRESSRGASRRPPTNARFEEAERLVKDAAAKPVHRDLDAQRERLGLLQQARERYREQFALDANPLAQFGIAYTAHQLGLFKEARTTVKALIATSPPEPLSTRAKDLLARLEADMVAQGVSLDEVDSTAKPAVPLTKAEQAVKLIAEANMEAHAGRYEQALAIFQRAYEIEPLARTLLSVCLMQSYNVARCQEARATCQQVRTMSPRDPVAEQARVLLDRLPCP